MYYFESSIYHNHSFHPLQLQYFHHLEQAMQALIDKDICSFPNNQVPEHFFSDNVCPVLLRSHSEQYTQNNECITDDFLWQYSDTPVFVTIGTMADTNSHTSV